MRRSIRLLIPLAMLLAFGCRHSRNEVPTSTGTPPDEEYLVGVNRDIVRNEATNIRLLIDRYGWNMKVDPAGYYYEILDEGHGAPLKKGDNVMMRCRNNRLRFRKGWCQRPRHRAFGRTCRPAGGAAAHEARSQGPAHTAITPGIRQHRGRGGHTWLRHFGI